MARSRDHAVGSRWNAISGRVLTAEANRRRPEVAVHRSVFAAAKENVFNCMNPTKSNEGILLEAGGARRCLGALRFMGNQCRRVRGNETQNTAQGTEVSFFNPNSPPGGRPAVPARNRRMARNGLRCLPTKDRT